MLYLSVDVDSTELIKNDQVKRVDARSEFRINCACGFGSESADEAASDT